MMDRRSILPSGLTRTPWLQGTGTGDTLAAHVGGPLRKPCGIIQAARVAARAIQTFLRQSADRAASDAGPAPTIKSTRARYVGPRAIR